MCGNSVSFEGGGAAMSISLRSVFVACTVCVVTPVAPIAQDLGTGLPTSIKVTLNKTGNDPQKDRVTLDNGDPQSSDQQKVWVKAGGTVTFEIHNEDGVTYEVRIPIARFVPSRNEREHSPSHGCGKPNKVRGNATQNPMEPKQNDKVTVAAGEVRRLMLKVKPRTHFKEFDKPPFKDQGPGYGMTYKYDILLSGGGRDFVCDPDIEVRQ
jgi:hypothetical protein